MRPRAEKSNTWKESTSDRTPQWRARLGEKKVGHRVFYTQTSDYRVPYLLAAMPRPDAFLSYSTDFICFSILGFLIFFFFF